MLKKAWPGAVSAAVILAAALTLNAAATFPTDEASIVHVLNRVTFGARASDVDRVRQIGLQRYIEEQLHPEQIPDAAMRARLAHLETVGLSSADISRQFEQPLLEARREKRQAATAGSDPNMQPPAAAPAPAQQRANGVLVELSEQKLLRAIYSDRQLQDVLTDFWFNHFNIDARKGRDRFLLTEYEREAIRPHVLGRFRDLLGATAESPAMLFYLDNWLSADPAGPHGSTGRAPRGANPGGIPRAPRRAVPLPPATAPRGAVPPGQNNNRRAGLNENYARELMELHTVGVDGGYTQKDVTEVARAFTGWTIDRGRQGARFRFDPRVHDTGEKIVLGHRIASGGGQRDAEQVLDILAAHPATARFVSTKLARRFVSDAPPSALVDRLAARFSATQGDLRAVMTTLLTSPEFLSPESHRAKVKSPFEFVVSAVRATGAEIADARPLVRSLQNLGMPLYQCQPPTGYKDTADAWTNTGALVNRMNFALELASGRPGAGAGRGGGAAGARRATGDAPGDALDAAPRGRPWTASPRETASNAWLPSIEAALAHDISDATRATIAKATSMPERVALALGSPEFQRR